jgi:hypothetical protein
MYPDEYTARLSTHINEQEAALVPDYHELSDYVVDGLTWVSHISGEPKKSPPT